MDPYGVELNESRASEAEKLLGKQHILQDSYQNLRVPKGSFNLLYENPPLLASLKTRSWDVPNTCGCATHGRFCNRAACLSGLCLATCCGIV